MVSLKYLLPAFAIFSCAASADALISHDSPQGAKYVAHFVPNDKYCITGFVKFTSTPKGFVKVTVKLDGFPQAGGPFPYHIHERPVPSNGDCMGTLNHLNPMEELRQIQLSLLRRLET
ncbi:uncharacterized protein RJT20DRAFT_55429 [Scheffersomyces xylosifermentans]|uniref:uncharacterized protein n=1 Tax=Scheffersomyces xylosifermentans TaxID=1304137 RepID=UPI00315D42AC